MRNPVVGTGIVPADANPSLKQVSPVHGDNPNDFGLP